MAFRVWLIVLAAFSTKFGKALGSNCMKDLLIQFKA